MNPISFKLRIVMMARRTHFQFVRLALQNIFFYDKKRGYSIHKLEPARRKWSESTGARVGCNAAAYRNGDVAHRSPSQCMFPACTLAMPSWLFLVERRLDVLTVQGVRACHGKTRRGGAFRKTGQALRRRRGGDLGRR